MALEGLQKESDRNNYLHRFFFTLFTRYAVNARRLL